MKHLTEEDLTKLIEDHLQSESCKSYHNICNLVATEEGKKRVVQRVKDIINNDGITSIDGCLAQIETDLIFSNE